MSTTALRIALVLATAIGCFPAKHSATVDVENVRFSWSHPIVAYSLTLLAFNTMSSINFFLNDLSAFVSASLGKSLAGNISGYIDSSNFLTGDMLIRIFAILYCSKTVKLIKIMWELKRRVELLRLTYDSHERGWKAPGPQPHRQQLYGKALELRRYKPKKMYVLLIAAGICHTINLTVKITRVVTAEGFPIFHTFWRFPGDVWIFKAVWWLNNWLAIGTYVFALSMIVFFGTRLLLLYQDLRDNLVHGLLSVCWGKSSSESTAPPTKHIMDQGILSDQLFEDFTALREAFKIFSEIAGTFALIQIATSCIGFSQGLFQFWVTKAFFPFFYCVSCFLWAYSMASIGDTMEVQIHEGSHNIKDAASLSRALCNDQLRAVTEIIMNWNWRFTARTIFVVNRSLLLGYFQTVMTYMIFLFQLKLSENSA